MDIETIKTRKMNMTDMDFRLLILREIFHSQTITLNDLKDFINIEALTEKIENYPEPRTCTQCGDGMYEGYCFPDALEYFCSEECLRANGVTEEEWQQYYDDDVGYWTTWEYELTDADRGRGVTYLF